MSARLGPAFVALALFAGGAAAPAFADSLVAARAIKAKSVIAADDLREAKRDLPGAVSDPAEAVGREARVTIFEGRPIRPGDLTSPTLVERNDIVRLRFARGVLEIAVTGRALDRGAAGDRVRVMNLEGRSVVGGEVEAAGLVRVTR